MKLRQLNIHLELIQCRTVAVAWRDYNVFFFVSKKLFKKNLGALTHGEESSNRHCRKTEVLNAFFALVFRGKACSCTSACIVMKLNTFRFLGANWINWREMKKNRLAQLRVSLDLLLICLSHNFMWFDLLLQTCTELSS